MPVRHRRRAFLASIGLVAASVLAACTSTTSPSKSTDNTLKALTISAGVLAPAFSAPGTSYAVSVPNATTTVTVTATTSSTTATIQIRGVAATSGLPSLPQPLSAGPNLIDITVYAEDGSVRIYDVTVTRAS